jgi:hypothetical protein
MNVPLLAIAESCLPGLLQMAQFAGSQVWGRTSVML